MVDSELSAARISELEERLAREPGSMAFVELVGCYLAVNRKIEALRLAERGLGLHPDRPEAHLAHGQALVVWGRLEEGIGSFERACYLAPGDGELLLRVADALTTAGHPHAAAPYLDKAARLRPTDARVAALRSQPAPPPGPPASASLDDPDDFEPPTMYATNPLALQRGREEPQETVADPDAGLRAEVAQAVERVALPARRAAEPPTFLAAGLGGRASQPDPWDLEPSVPEVAALPAAPATVASQRPLEPPTRLAVDGEVGPVAQPSSSVSYLKVFLIVLPLLLLAVVAGLWVGYRHLQAEEITDLLEQARGALAQDTLSGYADARDRLQKLLALDEGHAQARAMLALAAARLHDEFGPNLAMREEAERALGSTAESEDTRAWLLAARLALGPRPPEGELLAAIERARDRRPGDPDLPGLWAEALVRAGRPAEAKAPLDAALAAFPSDVRLLTLQAGLAEEAGDRDRAVELLKRVQTIHGGHARSLLLLARLRVMATQELDRTGADLERLLQQPQVTDRHRAEAHRWAAEVAFLGGDRSRGLSSVQAASGLQPEEPGFLLELARVCLRFRALDEVAALSTKVLERRPDDLEARLTQIAALLPRGRAREALKALESLLGQKVPAAPFLRLRGEALLASGQAAAAQADLRAVPAQAAEQAEARALLGLALLEAGEAEAARRELTALLKDAPGVALGHFAMGRYRLERNLTKGAAASFQKAVDLDPRCDRALTELGWLEFEARRPETAEAWVRRAIAMNPYSPAAHYLLGRLQLRAAAWQPALQAFARALQEQPDHAEALVGMAEALIDLGDLDKARLAIRKALQLGLADAHARHVEGRVELASGRFHPAVRALSAAAEKSRDDPEILADLGLAQLGARSMTAAEKSLRDSLRRGRSLRAQEGLGRLLAQKRQFAKAAQAYEAAAGLARRQGLAPEEQHRLLVLAARAALQDTAAGDGRYGVARRLWKLAEKALPDDPEALFETAATWDRQDKLPAARAAYQRLLGKHPDHLQGLFRLGVLEFDDRKEARAKELLTRYLELAPKGPEARKAEGILKRIK